jgi:hypothetical protein
MLSHRLYFMSKSQFVISNGVREIYKNVKQIKASVSEDSNLVAVEEEVTHP